MSNEQKENYLKIKIIKPPAFSLSRQLEEDLVGLELFGVRVPAGLPELALQTFVERPNRGGVIVRRIDMIETVTQKLPDAGKWLNDNVPMEIPYFHFGPDEFEILKKYFRDNEK